MVPAAFSRLHPSEQSPLMRPFSSTSIRSAAGTLGSPGMVMMSPVRATRKPAPADTLMFRTVTVKPRGAPSRAGSSEKLYWVLAMQMGRPPKPSSVSRWACFLAVGVSATPSARYTRRQMVSSLSSMEPSRA